METKKDYFTKYLPVEGEIKEGDIFQRGEDSSPTKDFPKFVRFIEAKDDVNKKYAIIQPNKGPEHLYFTDKLNPVKLFLCSRNIQIGDTLKECNKDNIARKVHHFESVLPYGIFVYEPWPASEEHKEEWIQANQAFKIIGEVSTEAVWVTEGMEFDIDDIKNLGGKVMLHDISAPGFKYYNMNPISSDFCVVKFKCPTCKTFH